MQDRLFFHIANSWWSPYPGPQVAIYIFEAWLLWMLRMSELTSYSTHCFQLPRSAFCIKTKLLSWMRLSFLFVSHCCCHGKTALNQSGMKFNFPHPIDFTDESKFEINALICKCHSFVPRGNLVTDCTSTKFVYDSYCFSNWIKMCFLS